MLHQHHQLHQTGATTKRSVAVECHTTSAASGCSSQQSAAAWAWFEHGGSTCITPRKAEGALPATKRNAKRNSASPSRFKKELRIRSTRTPDGHSEDGPSTDAITEGHSRRHHSFHNDDLTYRRTASYLWRFSTSFRSAPTWPQFDTEDEGAEQDEVDNSGEAGNANLGQDETTSLLDEFEVDALCKQLHHHLSSSAGGGSTSCSPCSGQVQQDHEAAKAHPQAHLKPHRHYFKSSDGAHKPASADNEHHHNIHDVVHWLLHFWSKTSPSRSTSAAPVLCSAIATADSIVDSHRRHPPPSCNKFRAVSPIKQKTKRQNTLHEGSKYRQRTGRVSVHSKELKHALFFETAGDVADHEHKRGQQKMPVRDLEAIGGASPTKLRHSKTLQHLVHTSALLGHTVHIKEPSRDHREAHTNQRDLIGHKHHHIYHHHHHYHHLQHLHHAWQADGTLLLDPLMIINKNSPKLHSNLHEKDQLIIPSDHGGHPHRDQYTAVPNPPSLYL